MPRTPRRTPRRTPQTPFDAQATYEVCAIEAKRRKRGNTEYLVLWKDCPPSDNTWEPLENLQGSEQLVNQFEKEWQANYDAAEAQASQDRERRRQNAQQPQAQTQKGSDSSLDQAQDLNRVAVSDAIEGRPARADAASANPTGIQTTHLPLRLL